MPSHRALDHRHEPTATVPLPQPDNDPLEVRPKLRDGLRFELRREDGREVVLIEDTIRNKFFQVGIREFELIAQLNGTRTLREALAHAQRTCPQKSLTEETALHVLQFLAQANLLVAGPEQQSQRLAQTVARQAYWQALSRFNVISCKIKLLHPEPLLAALKPLAHALFSRWGFALWMMLMVAGLYCMSGRWEQVFAHTNAVFANFRWLWLLIIWLGLKVIHEAGHALACKRFHVPVSEAGALLILFAPLAYVDVTASWRLASRWQRLVIAAAGMYVELSVAAAAAIVWYYLPDGMVADLCQQTILLASLTTLIVNVNPLMRFDGYYLLSDALGIVNLYSKGSQWLSDRWQSWFWGLPTTTKVPGGWRGKVIAIYGIAAFAWRIVLTLAMLLAASTLFDGAGLIFAFIAGIFWLAIPVWKHAQSLMLRWRAMPTKGLARYRRPLVGLIVFAAGLGWLFISPAPHWAPAIVEFKDESIVRLGHDGFLRRVAVSPGQFVRVGDVLAEFDYPPLEAELTALKAHIEACRLTARMLQGRGEIAAAQAEVERQVGLQRQYEEKCDWRNGQILRAPIDGIVVLGNLEHRLDTLFKQGEPVMSVVQPGQVEVIVSLDQAQADGLRAAERQRFRVYFSGFRTFEATVLKVSEKASDQLPLPAFGANHGGPLPVRTAAIQSSKGSADTDTRFLAPRFSASLLLVSAQELPRAGERGYLRLATVNYSRGWQWIAIARDWFYRKLNSDH